MVEDEEGLPPIPKKVYISTRRTDVPDARMTSAGHDPIDPRIKFGDQVYGPAAPIHLRDMELKAASQRIAKYYETNNSWVMRLALREYVKRFEEFTGVQVYFRREDTHDT